MLSIREVRRIALAAQGFAKPRPGKVTPRHLEETVRRIAPLQLDFVNVLVPAHYLIPFSRLGPYHRETLDAVLYHSGKFTEQWAHEAAVIPVETWPLLKHRMASHRVRPWGFENTLEQYPEYAKAAVEAIRERGPLGAHDLPDAPAGAADSLRHAWMGTFQRGVLEAQFGRGVLASANRLRNFVRTYDLAERRIPAEHFTRSPQPDEAAQELLRLAARAHGVGTAADLADYYRMNIREARQSLAELAAAGELERVRVEGWKEDAYLHPEAVCPAVKERSALLSPFDPLIWFRPRVSRLFGFDYRIEIYTPAGKRKYGYYVLPFLQDDRLTARVDVKADRAAGVLRVLAAHHEPDIAPDETAPALRAELQSLAEWLGLGSMEIERKGNLAQRLRRG